MSSSWQTQRHHMHHGRGMQGAAFYEVKRSEAVLIYSLYQCTRSLLRLGVSEVRPKRWKLSTYVVRAHLAARIHAQSDRRAFV